MTAAPDPRAQGQPDPGTAAASVQVFDVVVRRVQDLGPHFRRITFSGPALARLGVPEPCLDLRIKIILPTPGHRLSLPGEPGSRLAQGWYRQWLRLEQPGRGAIRSYTVRRIRPGPAGPELDVDFVLHHADGGSGPGSTWARAATPGTGAVFIGPTEEAAEGADAPGNCGITWYPGAARRVMLAGDETAVPAISAILEALPDGFTGHALLEVPHPGDFQHISTRSAVRIRWLARSDAGARRHGELLQAALRTAVSGSLESAPEATHADQLLPPAPGLSRTKARAVCTGRNHAAGMPEYAWLAGEAGMVMEMRRYLLQDTGMDRRQVTFRGYWSLGRAGSGVNGIPVRHQ
ncbi:siderophore-interacting protein [Arthrobacter sp. GCM10027362]|uniref:siderophore-interacting protein n=1 Tax=Arthrobacter sp. GCM10027362 TaxID=3273379 RepID=UPI003636B975